MCSLGCILYSCLPSSWWSLWRNPLTTNWAAAKARRRCLPRRSCLPRACHAGVRHAKILDAQKQAEEREQFKDPPQEADASGACLAVEQFDWKQLKVGPKNYCANCKRPVDAEPTFVVRKKGHQRMACKMCHNVTSMLYKKMDMKAVGFKDLSQEQVTDFYLKAGKIAESMGGLEWGKVQGLLQDTLTEKEVHSRKVKVSGKFLPLSVYERQGYDVQKIKEKGEMQKSDIFGEVFRVPTPWSPTRMSKKKSVPGCCKPPARLGRERHQKEQRGGGGGG